VQSGKISSYALGRDYHKVLGGRLKKLMTWLDNQAPGQQHRWYVDTGPIPEKVWAQRAGLGWIGKNSLLLNREFGSWIFLGVLLTTVELIPDTPTTAHCGTCRRCLDVCPTGALLPGGVLDSNLCISYHTIENPAEILPKTLDLADWVVGCDLCQTCCPFNNKTPFSDMADFTPRDPASLPLAELAAMSEATFDSWSQGRALRRLKVRRLRRNAQHNLDAATRLSQKFK
jgi:epoxyqueuosine reductase